MKAIYLAPLFAALLFSACKNTEADPAKEGGAASKPAPKQAASQPAPEAAWMNDSDGKYQVFGAGLASAAPADVAAGELAKNINKYEGQTLRVTGMVSGTCKKKGCWMDVAGGDGSGRVFVRFQDYGFFVPKEGAEGRKVVFEGVVSEKEFSIEETKHYLEDAGDFEAAKKVTAPSTVPFVMATGVKMYASK